MAPSARSAPLPEPHPEFLRAFADPFFRDEADELAPFGTDEGWDARETILRRGVPAGLPLADLLETELGREAARAALAGRDEGPDLDLFVIGIAFTMLWATGRLDAEGKTVLLGAVDRQLARYGDDPRLVRLRAGVAALPG